MVRNQSLAFWRNRFLAIALACLPFLMLEFGLRLMDYPPSQSSSPLATEASSPQVRPANGPTSPYVDLQNLLPLFAPAPDAPGELFIPEERWNYFRPVQFQKEKLEGTVRVFALGGSTTQGEPYSTETAFPAWLGIALQTATDRPVEVINCGGLSYASYRVLAILREICDYSPDLVVVYTGHNEFLERRSYELQRRASQGIVNRLAGNLRTVQLAKRALGLDRELSRIPKSSTTLSAEVDALLDYEGGLEEYHRDDPWTEGVLEHFRWNLQAMVNLCKEANVPLVLVAPVSNLADCPPFKMEVSNELSPQERYEFEQTFETARTAQSADTAEAAALRALAMDTTHTGVNYLLGQIANKAGRFDEAKRFLSNARDFDVCPLRAPIAFYAAVVDIAQRGQVPLVDADKLFGEKSPNGIVGKRWLVDHIHPNVEGHQLLGIAIAQNVLAGELAKLREVNEDWEMQIESAFSEHMEALGPEYFLRAQQRLEGLRLWTQGRARKVRNVKE